ncbi:MAG: LysE/ArgO family amino acid transporter [Oceanidesulfovibrio sp.]
MFIPFFQGFGVSGGLIVAIGAQNAYVLSQSVRRNHHVAVAGVCILCEMLLIGTGVAGVGRAVSANPFLLTCATWGGAVFLFWYGFGSFRSALRGGSLATGAHTDKTLKASILGTLAVTLLNPHAYLDTVVLLGGISGGYVGAGRYAFGAGALTASFTWFLSLAFFGKMLAPVFKRPAAWRILDTLVGLTMWGIAATLIMN